MGGLLRVPGASPRTAHRCDERRRFSSWAGASFGDGMATLHQRLGAVGAIVDGTVRDLAGIERVGLPMWAWGTVPGHGVFNLVRFGTPVTVGQLRIRSGDLVLADGDGCVRIPNEDAAEIAEIASQIRDQEAGIFARYRDPGFTVAKMRAPSTEKPEK
ncbi:MAG: RraA family protein [Caldilineaceae bacterium]